MNKIKHPGSLGALPKKQASSNGKYPNLQEATEEQRAADNKHLKKGTLKDHNVTPSAPTEEEASDPDAKPPRYESIQQRSDQQQSYVHFPGDISQNMPPPMMVTNGAWHPHSNMFQHPPQATNPIFMNREWIAEQTIDTMTML